MNRFQLPKNRGKILIASVFLLPHVLASFLALFGLLSLPSCRLYKLESKLDPENEKFLSEVRYIITRGEKKIFLELPDAEKENFIKDFWKKRDPDPDTEENEFQMEYYDRLETANKLFVGEGRPGFLTDRGRIYMHFGPPTERITYPMGTDPEGRCSEVWYYEYFPVVFSDYSCTGQYNLVTYDLSLIEGLNLMSLSETNSAQSQVQKAFKNDKNPFDFSWSLKKKIIEPDRIEGKAIIQIPYSGIWFTAKEDMLETTIDIKLELKDFKGGIIWEYKESFVISGKEDEIKEKLKKQYTIEIPFSLENVQERLKPGKSIMQISLKNTSAGEELRKTMEFH